MASKAAYSRWVGTALVFYTSAGTEIFRIDGANALLQLPSMSRRSRQRLAIATVNAGATLLAALSGLKYQLISVDMIAVGGAVGAVTTIDILGTQAASSVKLCSFAQAGLTQSTVLKSGGASTTVLADGASFAPCDANTAITINITGSAITTATSIDVLLNYLITT